MAAPQLRPGDEIEVACTALDARGAGVAEVPSADERLRLHVPGALPGEHVRVYLEHLSAHARGLEREAWAGLREILQPSPDRVEAMCPAYGPCGACTLMHLA